MSQSRHMYPFNSMLAEYARALVGLVLTLIPVIYADAGTFVLFIFLSLALLFLIYGIRTMIRHRRAIEIDDHAIQSTGFFGRRIAWDDMTVINLKYFATRRDRKGGWMQLHVGDGKRSLKIESQIEDFEQLVTSAMQHAQAREVALDDTTRTNLQSIGITLTE